MTDASSRENPLELPMKTTTLVIRGAMDANSVNRLRHEFDAAVRAKPALLVLDLSAVRMLDTTAIGAMMALCKRVRRAGGAVQVVGVSGQPRVMLDALRFDRILGMG